MHHMEKQLCFEFFMLSQVHQGPAVGPGSSQPFSLFTLFTKYVHFISSG